MRTLQLITFSLALFCSQLSFAESFEQGIYINHSTMEKTAYLDYLIKEANATNINAFVIDYARPSKKYYKNIEHVKNNGIKYVARIVLFPEGGKRSQIRSKAYWREKYALVKEAMKLGAKEIQLDYIRYSSKEPASKQNIHDVAEVLKWFKGKVAAAGLPLQVDMFGMSSYHEIRSIGQSVPVFAQFADVICPMNYPSHWRPYAKHSKTPYKTVFNAINALKSQFDGKPLTFKLYPYIELYNYHYRMPRAELLNYIQAQIKATVDGQADGWYAWSPNNKYNNLFTVLKRRQTGHKLTLPH